MIKKLRYLLLGGITAASFGVSSTTQAAISVSYDPYFGVAVNYSDYPRRQGYRRSNRASDYGYYQPRRAYRSSRGYNSGYRRGYGRGFRDAFSGSYGNRYYGRRCD